MEFVIITQKDQYFRDQIFCSLAAKSLTRKIWKYSTIVSNVDNLEESILMAINQYNTKAIYFFVNQINSSSILDKTESFILGESISKNTDDDKNLFIDHDVIQKMIQYQSICLVCIPHIFYDSSKNTISKHVNSIAENHTNIGNNFNLDDVHLQSIRITKCRVYNLDLLALMVMDSCIRCIPSHLKNPDILIEESFNTDSSLNGMLEYPIYTKPYKWKNLLVPEVLKSGNHQKILEWRISMSIEITKNIRPDLLSSK